MVFLLIIMINAGLVSSALFESGIPRAPFWERGPSLQKLVTTPSHHPKSAHISHVTSNLFWWSSLVEDKTELPGRR